MGCLNVDYFVLLSWISRTDLIEMPVPNIIEYAPDHIRVALDGHLLWPEVATGEARELLQVWQDFIEVCINSGHILRSPVKPLDDFISAPQPIQKVAEKHPVATVLGQVLDQLGRVDLVTDKFNVFNEPSD